MLRIHLLGAASPVTVRETEGGRLALAERPVGVTPPEEDEARLARLLRAQAEIAADMAELIDEETGANITNADRRIVSRLRAYRQKLQTNGELLWEPLDAAFPRLSPLLDDEGLDPGLPGTRHASEPTTPLSAR